MAKLLETLTELNDKIDTLAQRQQEMLDEIARLRSLNDDLSQELDETRARLHKAELDVEFLTMSHRLADTPEAVIETRRHIARLIRSLDLCINMLKE
ncbi:MAG: hypothetical protein K2H47_06075 [Muribaculaceae bacterium]|nr:hypothetical protein [Muribaculaceae bacterium]